ncbi:MAG: repressor protein [Chaetfec virus UA24_244]|nr:MAG: repressor protein [Chaetfec virus UA24_244]
MYFAQTTKERIKTLCRNKKINMEDMLISCGLGVNAIRQISDTKGMASFSLGTIADYLDCSVDYLLGRTDKPEVNR